MKITRVSAFTGQQHVIDLPVTQQQLDSYEAGVSAQAAFPDLEPWQRECIMQGVTKEEWDDVFGRGSSDRNTKKWREAKARRGGMPLKGGADD